MARTSSAPSNAKSRERRLQIGSQHRMDPVGLGRLDERVDRFETGISLSVVVGQSEGTPDPWWGA